MAYYITTTQGAPIATVQDATINTAALSITLIGRDYAGYGAFLNENFVHILENFAANTAPNSPLTGQLWYDTSTNTLKVWNTSLSQWKPISSSISAAVAPTAVTSTIGDLWWDNVHNQLYVFSGATNGWILIGPPNTSTGSGAITTTIIDSSSVSHTVVELKVNNNIVAIISNDSVFTPQSAIAGFVTINPGLNLVDTSALAGSQFTGSASNALTLNGVTSNQFLRSDQNAATQYQITAGGGFVIASDLTATLESASNRVAIRTVQNNRDLNFYVNQNGANVAAIAIGASTGVVTINDAAVVTGALTAQGAFTANTTTTLGGITTLQAAMVPQYNGTVDIGASATRFNNLYATTLYGNLVGNLSADSVIATGSLTVGGAVTIGGNLAARQDWVINYVQSPLNASNVGSNSQGTKTIQSIANGVPSNSTGNNGDIIYQY